jgi:hypothetical protein
VLYSGRALCQVGGAGGRNRLASGGLALPIIWGDAYLFIQSPVIMVQIGGVATGVFLLAVVVAVWYLRNNEVDPRLRGGGLFNAALIVSSLAIVLLGVYSALSAFGLAPGA